MVHPVFVQAFYYSIVMLLTIFFASLLQKGFFFKYMRVKLSFGRLIMVKIRAVNRDYFMVGNIEEGFLVYKIKISGKKFRKRIRVPGNDYFYKAIGVSWIDVDDEKNAICKPDYSVVSGYDAAKYDNLLQRAMTRPSVADRKEQIMILLIIVSLLVIIASVYLSYKNSTNIDIIKAQVNSMKPLIDTMSKGIVAPGGG